MIGICDIMQVPSKCDQEHWPVNKFQYILAHFNDQVNYICKYILNRYDTMSTTLIFEWLNFHELHKFVTRSAKPSHNSRFIYIYKITV